MDRVSLIEVHLLAIGYLQEYEEENKLDSDLKELKALLGSELKKIQKLKSKISIEIHLENVYTKLENHFKDNDIECNMVALVMQLCSLLLEYDYFVGSNQLKLKRLVFSILKKSEPSVERQIFNNASLIAEVLENVYFRSIK